MNITAAIQHAQPYEGLAEEFETLKHVWKEETGHHSSLHDKAIHRAYQRIIGMGPAVLPLIFRSMKAEPDHWFWALHAITGADPVPAEERGRVDAMTQRWLHWAHEQGIAF